MPPTTDAPATLIARDRDELDELATQIRREIVSMLETSGSGHTAGPLGMADLLAVLYGRALRHRPTDPEWSERDIFLLSNGHTAPVLYAALALTGYFPTDELSTLRRLGSRLQGHPERLSLPGLENTSGPLGSGLSQGAGWAHVLKHLDSPNNRRVVVMMGDGELNEGNIWEAAMYAPKYELSNLLGIIDRNFIQIDGETEDVMPLGDLAGKWRTFGWHVIEIDGNDVTSILAAYEEFTRQEVRPTMIIARTVPGKGVPFMEGDYRWHGKVPNSEQATAARLALGESETKR